MNKDTDIQRSLKLAVEAIETAMNLALEVYNNGIVTRSRLHLLDDLIRKASCRALALENLAIDKGIR